jgi:hypothetical protein
MPYRMGWAMMIRFATYRILGMNFQNLTLPGKILFGGAREARWKVDAMSALSSKRQVFSRELSPQQEPKAKSSLCRGGRKALAALTKMFTRKTDPTVSRSAAGTQAYAFAREGCPRPCVLSADLQFHEDPGNGRAFPVKAKINCVLSAENYWHGWFMGAVSCQPGWFQKSTSLNQRLWDDLLTRLRRSRYASKLWWGLYLHTG